MPLLKNSIPERIYEISKPSPENPLAGIVDNDRSLASMKSSPDLPESAVNAIRANRKIEAIKILREERGLDLKEAKHEVEAYMQANPSAAGSTSPPRASGANPLMILVVLALAGYLVYRLLVA